jgi:hypothetical protein
MKALRPDGVRFDLLLPITDSTTHMIKTSKGFSVSYLKLMLLVHYIMYVLCRVSETIRALYVNSDKLVDIVKKLFVKSPDGESSLKQSSRHTVPAAPLIIPLRTRRNANCEFGRKLPRSFVL